MHNWPCCLDHLHAVIFRDLTWFGFFLFFPTPSSFTHLSAQPPPQKALAPHSLCSVLHVSVLSWDRKQRKSFSSEDTHVDARRHRSRPLIKTTTVCGRAPVMIIEPLPAPCRAVSTILSNTLFIHQIRETPTCHGMHVISKLQNGSPNHIVHRSEINLCVVSLYQWTIAAMLCGPQRKPQRGSYLHCDQCY